MHARIMVLAAFAASVAVSAIAQTSSGQPPNAGAQKEQGPGHRHRPPPQAIAACDGKKSGDACSFTGRENENVSGTCFSPPARAAKSADDSPTAEDRPLACRPSRRGADKGKAG